MKNAVIDINQSCNIIYSRSSFQRCVTCSTYCTQGLFKSMMTIIACFCHQYSNTYNSYIRCFQDLNPDSIRCIRISPFHTYHIHLCILYYNCFYLPYRGSSRHVTHRTRKVEEEKNYIHKFNNNKIRFRIIAA